MKANVELWMGEGMIGNLEVRTVRLRSIGAKGTEIEFEFKDSTKQIYLCPAGSMVEVSKTGTVRKESD